MSELYREEWDNIFYTCYNEKENLEYNDYINRICRVSIVNEGNKFYINPRYRYLLNVMNLSPEYCDTDIIIKGEGTETKSKTSMNWEIINDILNKEVERCRELYSNKAMIETFLGEIIEKFSSDVAVGILESIQKDTEESQHTEG